MMYSIKVIGANPIDESIRVKAIESIVKNLTTSQLQKINQLATNPKARDFLDNKFSLLKTFI